MYRQSRNAKFIPRKLNIQHQDSYQQHPSSIQEMSVNLLNEIDRKYESFSCDPQRDRSLNLNKDSASKGFSSTKNSLKPQQHISHTSLNHKSQVQYVGSYTQPSERKYSHKKQKQTDKIQAIQQSYLRFKENYSTKKSSIVDKENFPVNIDKGDDEINHIITCLEKRFIHDGRSNKSNKSMTQHSQTKYSEQQLIQNVQNLNNRDASSRLDLAKIKKQNSELNQKYNDSVQKIVELEKLQKRDNEYIIRMDNNMMQMKQKLTQIMSQKNSEQDKINKLQQHITELQQENTYLKCLHEQNNEYYQQKDSKNSRSQEIREKSLLRQSLQQIERRNDLPTFQSGLPTFQSGSSMSNFSFVQNSERKHGSSQSISQERKSNGGVDGYMIHQILNLNEQLTKQISLSKLSKDQANEFISFNNQSYLDYLQDQITNTSSHSDQIESQYRKQLTEPDMDDQIN